MDMNMNADTGTSQATTDTGGRTINKGAVTALAVLAVIIVAVIIAGALAIHHQKVEDCFWSQQYAGHTPADARALC